MNDRFRSLLQGGGESQPLIEKMRAAVKPPQQETPPPELPPELQFVEEQPEWDYKTAPTDPQGNPLPEGALGWTPFGQAYFGPGIQGTLKRYWYELVGKPSEKTTSDDWQALNDRVREAMAEVSLTGGNELADRLIQAIPGLGFVQTVRMFAKDPSLIGETLQNIGGLTDVLEGEKGTAVSSPLTPVLRASKVGLEVLFDTLSEAAIKTEQTFGALQGIQQYANEKSELPDLQRPLGDLFADMKGGEWEARYEQAQVILNPVATAWDIFRFITAPGTLEEKQQALETGWNAGRMFYSQFIQPSTLEEYKRRVAAGDDPYLTALELQNPWAEAVGQMVLDPLNLVGLFAKAGKVARVEDAADIARRSTVVDEVGEVLADVSKTPLGETRAAEKMEAIDAAVQRGFRASDERLTLTYAKAEEYTPSGLRLKTKKAHDATAMIFTSAVMRNGGTPNDVAELVYWGTKLSSADKAQRLEALDNIIALSGKYGLGRMAFSDNAIDFFNTVGKLADADNFKALGVARAHGAENLIQLLQAAKGDPAKAAEILGEVITKGVEYSIPLYEEMKAAAKAAAEGGEVSARTAQLAEKFKKLPKAARALQEFNLGKPGQIKRWINDKLSQAFFGWQYGPGARNFMSNLTHLFVDSGVKGGIGSFFREGKWWSLSRIEDDLKAWFGGTLPPDLVGFGMARAEGAKQSGKILGFIPKPAQFMEDTERSIATRIYYQRFRETMDKVLTPGVALPTVQEFRAAGMSDEGIKHFIHILRNEAHGNLEEAIIRYVDEFEGGSLDAWKRWEGFVTDHEMQGLRELGLDAEIDAIKNAKSREEVQAAFRKLRTELDNRANTAAELPRHPPKEAAGFEAFDDIGGATKAGYIDADGTDQLGDMLIAADKAQGEFAEALGKARDAYNRGRHPRLDFGVIERAHSPQARRVVRDKTKGLVDAAWSFTRNKDTSRANLARMWKQSILSSLPVPDNLTPETFRRALWTATREAVSLEWERYFAEYFKQLAPLVEQLRGFAPELNSLFAKADKASAELNLYRTARYRGGKIFAELPPRNVWEAAKRFGISTIDESGRVANDRHLIAALKQGGLDVTPQMLRDGANDPEFIQTVTDVLRSRQRSGEVVGQVAETATIEKSKFTMETAASVPRSQLPPEVSKALELEARKMLDEILGAQPGTMGRAARQGEEVGVAAFGSSYPEWYGEIAKKGGRGAVITALEKIIKDKGVDTGKMVERLKEVGLDMIWTGDRAAGTPPDLAVMARLGADERSMQDALDAFNDITGNNFTMEEAIAQSQRWAGIEPPRVQVKPPVSDEMNAPGAWFHHNRDGAMAALDKVEQGMLANYGVKAAEKYDAGLASRLTRMFKTKDAKGLSTFDKLTEGAAMADRVGKYWRDFALLPYGETRNLDLMLSYVMPYQFWYSRTYKNWMARVASDPQVIANYARLKDAMAKEHKDSPEWWKFNVTLPANFLGLGLDPMSFNLEANLWPLYGLTGVDFNDPDKRVNWWTATIDDMGKFGPSVWSPINWAVAAILSAQGEKDAASRWAGRIIPQTATIRAASSYFGQPIEVDPLVHLFSGGVDPYERSRVGRVLSEYVQQGQLPDGTPFTEEQAIEVARLQSGPIWDMAVRDAVRSRAGGQLASSFLGVGFKARSPEEARTDRFYQDYHRLQAMARDKLISPDQIRQAYDALREAYPFMDTLLLSRRSGPERDSAYAYSIIGRIPPGASKDLYALAGIDPATAQKFYESGGDISVMPESERMRFLAGMIDLGAMLAIPDYATKQAWTNARIAYGDMKETVKAQFGEDIYDKIEYVYGLEPAQADAYLAQYPEVDAARRMQDYLIMQTPALAQYYGGIEVLERYYTGTAYDTLEKEFGKNIQTLFDQYYELQLTDPKAASAFKRAHPEMEAYSERKKELLEEANRKIIALGQKLPDAPQLQIREDFTPQTPIQELLAGYNPQGVPPEALWSEMSPALQQLVQIYLQGGDLSYSARKQLEYIGEQYGMSADEVLRRLGIEQ